VRTVKLVMPGPLRMPVMIEAAINPARDVSFAPPNHTLVLSLYHRFGLEGHDTCAFLRRSR
jgi:hypothetical protein